jgi:ArsR family transcriptional regulator
MDKNELARVCKAFCDPNRLRVLELLRHGERCACELLEGLAIDQSTLSHHMRILCDARIVRARKVGRWHYYSFHEEGIRAVKEQLAELTMVDESAIVPMDEHCYE